jgi:hypothetical protein
LVSALKEPTFDADGYPTDETLDTIREWDWHDFPALMAFVASAWHWGGFGNKPSLIEPLFDEMYADDGHWWSGATGGWSGNESLIAALDANMLFAAMCWNASLRGGYHEYHVRPPEKAGT